MTRRMPESRPAFALLWSALALSGCGGPADPPPRAEPAPKAEAGAATTKEYALKGTVRRVDAGAGEVTIAHQAMPGFMDAMTMPFTVADKSALGDVRPGDEVEGRFLVDFDAAGKVAASRLADLTVSKPAPEAAVSTDTGAPAADGAVLAVGAEVPDFTVIAEDGTTFALSSLRGNVVVLTFIYTRCPLPEFCPAMDAKFVEMARKLRAVPGRSDRVRLLSVSFDPEHDTPATLAAHARRVGAAPPLWRFAVASHDELRKVAAPLGLSYGPAGREILHNLCTAVIDGDGKLARLDAGSRGRKWTPDDLLGTIRAEVSDLSK